MTQSQEKKSEIPADLEDRVGQRIAVDKFKGTIRYVGPVATSKKASTVWLGIEWDDLNRGKNDGSVTTSDGTQHRYFTCADGKGSFIKPIKANFGRDLLSVILDRFSLDSLEDDIKEQEQIASDSAYKIEFVGWDKSVRRQCNLLQKTSLYIEELDVTHIDMNKLKELRETVPEVAIIDIRHNMITSLTTWPALRVLGDTLKEINLSHNPLNCVDFKTIRALFDAQNGFNQTTFPNLQKLCMNNCRSATFNPWQFVYLLAMNGCVPQLKELELCVNKLSHFKLPSHIVNNELDGDPSASGDDTAVDGTKIGQMLSHLSEVNIGENPCGDWIEIGDVWGHCASLSRLQCSYMSIEQIVYRKGIFDSVMRIWSRNNEWKELKVFDELNLFPSLHQLNFVQNSFEQSYGHSTLRDFAIAKIAELRVCNSSVVNAKERNDAEMFYLKWIAKQIGNKRREEEQEMKETQIDALYPRYIELSRKHGAINLDKNVQEKLLAVTVTIRSMDPRSITAKPVEKKLPTAMTVAQLKLLCKRLFKLNPQHQRLMYREVGTQAFPDDLFDDTRSLAFYNIKDGME
eukprot:206941_1